MIVPLYKPYGSSSHKLAQQMGKILNEKATHTGTLDPAAEGVLIVVTGDDRFKKNKLSSVSKVYQAQILLGISTDTHDLIGLPTVGTVENSIFSLETLEQALKPLVGSYNQTQPVFSAKRVSGQSYFDLAKTGKELPPIKNSITIHSIRLTDTTTIQWDQLAAYQAVQLKKIQGDFRQAEISKKWQLLSKKTDVTAKSFQVINITVSCSKRTYIRSLVRDLSQRLAYPTTLFSLIRTENGPYSIEDCLCLLPSK